MLRIRIPYRFFARSAWVPASAGTTYVYAPESYLHSANRGNPQAINSPTSGLAR